MPYGKLTEIGTYHELVNGNNLLLANGFPVNFFSSESVLDRIIDIILTLMFSGAISLAKGELYLFGMSSDFKKELKNKKMSKDLKRVFGDYKCSLSINAKVSIVDNNEWKIRDGKKGL